MTREGVGKEKLATRATENLFLRKTGLFLWFFTGEWAWGSSANIPPLFPWETFGVRLVFSPFWLEFQQVGKKFVAVLARGIADKFYLLAGCNF